MRDPFNILRDLVASRCGLMLDAARFDFVESRLRTVMKIARLADFSALVAKLESGGDPALLQQVIDALMTNETFFFRDRAPFDVFRETILPRVMAARAGQKRIRIWSAACSTGQEPYSLAMLLDEEARALAGWRIEVVATDVSLSALKTAKAGIYTQFEVQRGLPVAHLLRYFQREGDGWRVSENIRSRIDFRQANLIQDFRHLGVFDVIFCRNVLIYFDGQTKATVAARLAPALADDGYLVLGATESLMGLSDAFIPNAQTYAFSTKRVEPRLRLATA